MSRQASVSAQASNAATAPALARAPTPAPAATKTASKKRNIDETEPEMPPTQQKRTRQPVKKSTTRKTKAGSAPPALAQALVTTSTSTATKKPSTGRAKTPAATTTRASAAKRKRDDTAEDLPEVQRQRTKEPPKQRTKISKGKKQTTANEHDGSAPKDSTSKAASQGGQTSTENPEAHRSRQSSARIVESVELLEQPAPSKQKLVTRKAKSPPAPRQPLEDAPVPDSNAKEDEERKDSAQQISPPQDSDIEQIGGAEVNKESGGSQITSGEDASNEPAPAELGAAASPEDEENSGNDKSDEPAEGGRRLRSSRLKTRKKHEADATAVSSKKRKRTKDEPSSNEAGQPAQKKKIWYPPGWGKPDTIVSMEDIYKYSQQFAGEPARCDDSLDTMQPVQVRSFEDWIQLQPVLPEPPAAYQPDPAIKVKEATQTRKKAKAAYEKWAKQRDTGDQPIFQQFRISPDCDQRRLQADLDRATRKSRKKGPKGDYQPEIANNRLPVNDDVVSPINAYQDLYVVCQAFDVPHENTTWIFANPKQGLPLPANIQCGVGDVKASIKDVLKQKLLERVEVTPESEDGMAALETVRKWAMRQGGGGYTLGEETYGEWNSAFPHDYVPVDGDW